MMWLKACPRCRGDLFLESDEYGRFVNCIQCGGVLDKAQEDRLFQVTAQLARRKPQAASAPHAVASGGAAA
jgi:Zn-finger nucleic acid-binding protein